jgi:hypothetical protein
VKNGSKIREGILGRDLDAGNEHTASVTTSAIKAAIILLETMEKENLLTPQQGAKAEWYAVAVQGGPMLLDSPGGVQ